MEDWVRILSKGGKVWNCILSNAQWSDLVVRWGKGICSHWQGCGCGSSKFCWSPSWCFWASAEPHLCSTEEPALNTGIKMSPQGKKWVLHLLMQLHTGSTDLWQPGRCKALWQGQPGALWLSPWHCELGWFWFLQTLFFCPGSWAVSLKFLAIPLLTSRMWKLYWT